MIQKLLCILFCSSYMQMAMANPDSEKIYLTQIVNQINALQPLIMAAEKAQPPDQRVIFHYQQYRDSQGHSHNGLFEDVQAVKTGIIQHLNTPAIEPRLVNPLQGDYLNLKSTLSTTLPSSK